MKIKSQSDTIFHPNRIRMAASSIACRHWTPHSTVGTQEGEYWDRLRNLRRLAEASSFSNEVIVARQAYEQHLSNNPYPYIEPSLVREFPDLGNLIFDKPLFKKTKKKYKARSKPRKQSAKSNTKHFSVSTLNFILTNLWLANQLNHPLPKSWLRIETGLTDPGLRCYLSRLGALYNLESKRRRDLSRHWVGDGYGKTYYYKIVPVPVTRWLTYRTMID